MSVNVLADGVYYQGNEPGDGGCGWAWINASAYNMIGANDIAGCSFAAMRHEVGHNLGLYHNGSTNIGSGFAHPLEVLQWVVITLILFESPSI